MSASEKLVRSGVLAKAGHDFALGNFAGEVGDDLPGPEEELLFVAGSLLRKGIKWLPKLRGTPEARDMRRAINEAERRGERFDPVTFKIRRQQMIEERHWNAFVSPVVKADREADRQTRNRTLAEVDALRVDRGVVLELFEAADRLVTVQNQNSDGKYLYHSFYRGDLAREEQFAYGVAARLQYRIAEYSESNGTASASKAAQRFLAISHARPQETPVAGDIIRFSNHLALDLGREYDWLPGEEEIHATAYAMDRANRLLAEQATDTNVALTVRTAGRVALETLQFASTDLWGDVAYE